MRRLFQTLMPRFRCSTAIRPENGVKLILIELVSICLVDDLTALQVFYLNFKFETASGM